MSVSNVLTNPVSLKRLQNFSFVEPSGLDLILKEDIWKKGILVLRSGKRLTDDIIQKLLNFGVDEINVHFNSADYAKEENKAVEELKQNFIETQNVLIIDKNYIDVRPFVNNLVSLGFDKTNIYLATDIRAINKYIKSSLPDYLFIDYNSRIEEYIKAIKGFESFKNIHIFITISEGIGVNFSELENKFRALDTELIIKPAPKASLKNMLDKYIEQDFNNLLRNDQDKNHNIDFSMM